MTQPRAALVSLDATPWYHLVNRCVRRAFMCGTDAVSGHSYEHRRGWISDRLRQLAGVFAIDVAAHFVLSAHQLHQLVERAKFQAQNAPQELLDDLDSFFNDDDDGDLTFG